MYLNFPPMRDLIIARSSLPIWRSLDTLSLNSTSVRLPFAWAMTQLGGGDVLDILNNQPKKAPNTSSKKRYLGPHLHHFVYVKHSRNSANIQFANDSTYARNRHSEFISGANVSSRLQAPNNTLVQHSHFACNNICYKIETQITCERNNLVPLLCE